MRIACLVLLGVFRTSEAYALEPYNPLYDTIIVTAQKRVESVDDVPISISTLDANIIDTLKIRTLEDAALFVPGLNIQNGFGSSNPSIFLRGVGIDSANNNENSAVGIYLDEAYIGVPSAQLNQLFDVERVEVLKGPQGTLYGRNTTGGLIAIHSKKPTDDLSLYGSLDYGRFNQIEAEAAIGGPVISGHLNARIAGFYNQRDGTVFNRFTDQNIDARQEWGARLLVDYVGHEKFNALLSVYGGRIDNDAQSFQHQALLPVSPEFSGPDGLCAPAALGSDNCLDGFGYADTDGDLFAGAYNEISRETVDIAGATLKATVDLGVVDLTMVSSFLAAETFVLEDSDASPFSFLTGQYQASDRQFTQEIRLASTYDAPFQWIIGGFYLHDRVDNDDSGFDLLRDLREDFITADNPTGINLGDPPVFFIGYPYEQVTNAYAAFAQGEWQITNTLTFTGGLRYTNETRSFDFTQTFDRDIIGFTFNESLNFDALSGRASLDYQITPDILAFASYSRGFKSGGFNGSVIFSPEELTQFDPETLSAYEVGLKAHFADDRIRTTASAYYYDYQDIQAFALVNNGGIPVSLLTNAAAADIFGFETEIFAQISTGFSLAASMSVLDTEFTDFLSDPAFGGHDFTGNSLPGAPGVSGNVVAYYDISLKDHGQLSLQTDVTFQSREFLETTNARRLSQGAFALLGARLAFQPANTNLEVSVWGRNILNQRYITEAFNLSDFGFDQLIIGDRATYGVTLTYRK